MVEAHNSFFERMIWKNIMVPRYDWPEIMHEQWRCTAAVAAHHSLPRALEDAVQVLNLPFLKDTEGGKVMKKLSKPRKLTKPEIKSLGGAYDPEAIYWHETLEDLRALWNYCRSDVLAEEALSERLGDLPPKELRVWQLDQRMNERGIKIDVDMAHEALLMAARAKKEMNAEIYDTTGVPRGTMREKIKTWLFNEYDLRLPNTQGETIDRLLALKSVDKGAKRILELVKSVNKSSTAKYSAFLKRVSKDGRLRDILMYQGADRTGRWSGKGAQLQNLPRGVIKDMDAAAEDIKEGNFFWLQALYGDVMEFLSSAVRGLLTSSSGHVLYVADFSAIEARVLLWLADARSALRVFETGGDIYIDMAEFIYRREIDPDSMQRQMGKQVILGSGFGMGFCQFLLTLRGYKIHMPYSDVRAIVPNYYDYRKWLYKDGKRWVKMRDDLNLKKDGPELIMCKYLIDSYRQKYPEVVQMWHDQERAAKKAVLQPGSKVPCGRVVWLCDKNREFLRCRLPSGRCLYYFKPKLARKKAQWGEIKTVLTYMGKGDSGKWCRQHTYGAKLVENITQGAARDLMAHAMLNLEKHGVYKPLLTVHDEIISEVEEGRGSKKEYIELMTRMPKWAKGCPVDADAWEGLRYKKA